MPRPGSYGRRRPRPGRDPPHGVSRLAALIAESETGWCQLYNELGLTPYQVIYEELSSPDGYEHTIRGVLAHLGLADYQGPIPAPQTRALRRSHNDEALRPALDRA